MSILNCCVTVNRRLKVRSDIAPSVFMVLNMPGGGGGTGFAVSGKSGNNYIVTNAHVCDDLPKIGTTQWAYITNGVIKISKRVLEISKTTDLCIIEGIENVKPLKLAKSFVVGQEVHGIGHPELGPLTMTGGEINAVKDIWFVEYELNISSADKLCNAPKESKSKSEKKFLSFLPAVEIDVCIVTVKDAINTTVLARPGSSGSPLIDSEGQVVGVLFAIDDKNWAFAVPLKHLQKLLSSY